MATFNLTNTNVSTVNRLQPWTINDVVLKGVELKTGKTKDGNEWKAMQLKFSGDNGIFEPMFFCPKEGGDIRPTGTTNGRNWELPSQMEQLAFTISHVVGTLAPTNYEKLQKVSLELPADFEKLVELVKKALTPAINKTTKIKLIGDRHGYASVPNFITIRDGEAKINNNWIGNNLAFSVSEIKAKEKAAETKPTVMKDDISDVDNTSEDNSDLDFDI